MISSKLVIICCLLAFDFGCGNKSEARGGTARAVAGSVYTLSVGADMWRAKVDEKESTVKIQKTTGSICEEWNINFLEKTFGHDLKSAGKDFFYPQVSGPVEVVENKEMLSFRPLTAGSQCTPDDGKLWSAASVDLTRVLEKKPFSSSSSKFDLETTDEDWEHPYDFAFFNVNYITPLISLKQSTVVGFAISLTDISSMRKEKESIASLPPGFAAHVHDKVNPDPDFLVAHERFDTRSLKERNILYDLLDSEASRVGGATMSNGAKITLRDEIIKSFKKGN